MKTLRNFLLLFALAFTVNTASAQLAVGPVATLGFNLNDLGIGARGTYDINDQFRPAADVIYYLVDGATAFGINANLHYKFAGQTGGVQPYVLAGLGFVSVSVDLGPFGNASATDTGLNLGGGVTLPVGNATFFGEGVFGVGGSEFGLLAGLLFSL